MAKGRKASKKPAARAQAPLPQARDTDDMYDEVDRYHMHSQAEADELSEDEESAGDDDEQAILDLDAGEDSDDEARAGGKLSKIILAERALKRRLDLQQEDSDEAGDDNDSAHGADDGWGRSKRSYYDAEDVDVDFDSDDEVAEEEAEEAKRLEAEHAKQLNRDAFGLEDDDSGGDKTGTGDESDSSASERTERVRGTIGALAEGTGVVRTEEVTKVAGDMSKEEANALVLRDAPELASLLRDLSGTLREVRQRVSPVLAEVQVGGLVTSEGLSYLEAKHMLLLAYCAQIMFYILLKLEGRQVREHPVIQRLVATKAYLDKIRPIDRRLRPQIDKLLRAADVAKRQQQQHQQQPDDAAAPGAPDPLSFKARPEELVSRVDEDQGGDGVYRPPRLAAAMMADDAGAARAAAQRRRAASAARRAKASEFVRELEAEVTGAPEEVVSLREGRSGDSLGLLKERQKLEARARVEEDMMTRVPLSKDERKRLRSQQRAGLSGLGLVEDFADDVAGVVEADKDNALYFDKVRLGQKFGVDMTAQRAAPASGDADVAGKAGLAERRARYDALKARQMAQLEEAAADAAAAKRPRGFEDEFYQAAKADAQSRKKAKRDSKTAAPPHAPLPDATVTQARGITSEIHKNRGLTPHRRKDLKNPRKHNRVKFAKAEKRRGGQVQKARTAAGPYSGEATGIKSRVTKSTRFQ